jgi:hypothetical protein
VASAESDTSFGKFYSGFCDQRALLSTRGDLHKRTCDREELALLLFGVSHGSHVATEVIALAIFDEPLTIL